MKSIIKTKCGTLYTENFNNREEMHRIKIYDTRYQYLDYFSVESIEQDAKINGCTKYQQLAKYYNELEQCNCIEDLLNFLGIEYEKISLDWKIIAKQLKEITGHQYKTAKELLKNEWVNKIGKHYILISE